MVKYTFAVATAALAHDVKESIESVQLIPLHTTVQLIPLHTTVQLIPLHTTVQLIPLHTTVLV